MTTAPTIAGPAHRLRSLGLGAAGILLAAAVSACGGDDSPSSAPDDASREDFCEAFNGLFSKVMSGATSGDSADMVRALKEWARDIEQVGTPADMPDDARHGFELFLQQAEKIEDDASLQDLEKLGEDLSDADQKDGVAFSDWTQENCPLDLPSLDPSGQGG